MRGTRSESGGAVSRLSNRVSENCSEYQVRFLEQHFSQNGVFPDRIRLAFGFKGAHVLNFQFHTLTWHLPFLPYVTVSFQRSAFVILSPSTILRINSEGSRSPHGKAVFYEHEILRFLRSLRMTDSHQIWTSDLRWANPEPAWFCSDNRTGFQGLSIESKYTQANGSLTSG